MVGLKYKLAHKRAGKETWSASDAAQKRHLVALLKEMIARLEAEPDVVARPRRATTATGARATTATRTRAPAHRTHRARATARVAA